VARTACAVETAEVIYSGLTVVPGAVEAYRVSLTPTQEASVTELKTLRKAAKNAAAAASDADDEVAKAEKKKNGIDEAQEAAKKAHRAAAKAFKKVAEAYNGLDKKQ
jgi:hypothetical protein